MNKRKMSRVTVKSNCSHATAINDTQLQADCVDNSNLALTRMLEGQEHFCYSCDGHAHHLGVVVEHTWETN